jgi:anti-sigma factor RsiW
MENAMTDDPGDRALWKRLARPQAPAPAVSADDLAAWLDGRLDGAAAARVEAALAADPALLDAALEAHQAQREPLPAAPERLVVRARALVAPAVTAPSRRIDFWSGWLGRGVQWGAVGTLALAISVGGFALGNGTQSALAGQRTGGTGTLFAVLDSLGADAALLDDGGSDP